MGLLEWVLGTVGSDLGLRHFKSSSIRLEDTRGLLPEIIGRLRNWSDFCTIPARRGELLFLKGVKRHRIDIPSWQRAAVYYGRSYARGELVGRQIESILALAQSEIGHQNSTMLNL